jgi:alpha-L-rhamnosidase
MPIDLRCERLVNPIGVGTAAPRLSWRLDGEAAGPGAVQTAAQVLVGEEGARAPFWESGRIETWRMQMRYGGPPLRSRGRYWWRVRAWTAGEAGPRLLESEPACFETGLLHGNDWTARMIRPAAALDSAAVRFVTRFASGAADPIVRARLYCSAHGIVLPLLNGVEITDELLAPGWTSYHHRLAVRTVDVTAHLRAGENELALVVAPGWFSGRLGWQGQRGLYGDYVAALAQLEIERASGARRVIATGEQGWLASTTPWLEADLYDGETFDARRGLAPATSVPVVAVDLDVDRVLVAPPVPPVRRTAVLAPKAVRRLDDGTVAVDVGQNISGWLRLTVSGLPAGAELALRHAEILDGHGRLFTEPLRSARATDRFIAAGHGSETYEPRFTFHGFRYAEISGVPEHAVLAVEAVAIHSDFERTGTFTCSDERVNRLHEAVVWGWRDNAVSVPTDCPQRDERLGWTGDIQVFAPTATYLYDCETFLENWLADLRADQLPDGAVPPFIPSFGMERNAGRAGWADAAVIVPWVLYEAYGDETVLRESLSAMAAHVEYVHTQLDADGIWSGGFQFGDWLDPDAPTETPWRAKARAPLVATAYAARSTELLARAARVLGEDQLTAESEARSERLKQRWRARFAAEALATQTGCALAIAFGLVPADERQRYGDRLAELVHAAGDHLATGFLGTPLLLPALSQTGHHDVACALLRQETPPSWLYQIKAGATTIWERWDALRSDGSVPTQSLAGAAAGMVSFNHYAYGSVADWLHRFVLGIAPDATDPGYHRIAVAPRPCAHLAAASGTLRTRYGELRVAWRVNGGRFDLALDVPPNARAGIRLPGGEERIVSSGHHELRAPAPEGCPG